MVSGYFTLFSKMFDLILFSIEGLFKLFDLCILDFGPTWIPGLVIYLEAGLP